MVFNPGSQPLPGLSRCIGMKTNVKRGRWHRTKTASADRFRPVLSLIISNEQLWNQGLYYRGIHIGTKDDKITSDYDWWSYGRFIEETNWLDTTTAPEHSDISDLYLSSSQNLVRATLRDVKERVQAIPAKAVKEGEPAALLAWAEYCRKTLRQAITRYGANSAQVRLLSLCSTRAKAKSIPGQGLHREWVPSWQDIMTSGQGQQEAGTTEPQPPQRSAYRQRPRHRDTPGTTPTPHQSRTRRYREREIPSCPDSAPEAIAGSGTTKVEVRPAPRAHPRFQHPHLVPTTTNGAPVHRQPRNPRYQDRSTFPNADPLPGRLAASRYEESKHVWRSWQTEGNGGRRHLDEMIPSGDRGAGEGRVSRIHGASGRDGFSQ